MKFLLDQDVYAATARFLSGLGHDVVTAHQAGRSQTPDSEMLTLARESGRIFVTRDRDFGGLVFVMGLLGGLLYLRLLPSTLDAVHQELAVVLRTYSEQLLRGAFVVVEPGRHRFRKIA